MANYKKPEDLIGENGLLKQLTKLLDEKALDAEPTQHLGHERHEAVANTDGNQSARKYVPSLALAIAHAFESVGFKSLETQRCTVRRSSPNRLATC